MSCILNVMYSHQSINRHVKALCWLKFFKLNISISYYFMPYAFFYIFIFHDVYMYIFHDMKLDITKFGSHY